MVHPLLFQMSHRARPGDVQEPRNVWPKVRRVTAEPRAASPPSPSRRTTPTRQPTVSGPLSRPLPLSSIAQPCLTLTSAGPPIQCVAAPQHHSTGRPPNPSATMRDARLRARHSPTRDAPPDGRRSGSRAQAHCTSRCLNYTISGCALHL